MRMFRGKMVTVIEELPTKERCSVVRFSLLSAKDIHKELFPIYGGKRFTTESINVLKDVRKSQMMPGQVRKWLRQQPKHFCAAGFDALVKRWDKCINVGGGYVEK
jgi:hypothetical protein